MSGVNTHVPPEFRTRGFHGGSKKGRNIGPAVIGVNSPWAGLRHAEAAPAAQAGGRMGHVGTVPMALSRFRPTAIILSGQ
jgi:hypothetical protein